MGYRLKDHRKHGDGRYILKVEKTPGIIGSIFGAESKLIEYYGSATVWHKMPEMQRCPSFLEGILADFYTRVRFEESSDKK